MGTDEQNRKTAPSKRPNVAGIASSERRGVIHGRRASFDWTAVDAEDIGRFVQRATNAGLGVILGRTSDGGALSVTLLDGDDRVRDWPNSVAAWDELHRWLVTSYGLD